MFPVPEASPAHHVRELRFWCGWSFDAPDKFFEYIPWFTSVRKVLWSGQAELEPLCRILSSGRLSHSTTSLAIHMDSVTVLQIRDVMEQLPNLTDLSLSGSLVKVDKDILQGVGRGLRCKFGGQLRLLKGHVDADIVNMLLEVPAGLHFTEVYIHSPNECLRPTLMLTEACGESLAKLTYTVDDYSESLPFLLAPRNISFKLLPDSDGHEAFDRTFNLAKFPNLKEVEFSVNWTPRSLLWITKILSTLKPSTSPRLSVIQLEFSSHQGRVLNDFGPFEAEVARVRGEFMGVASLTVKGIVFEVGGP